MYGTLRENTDFFEIMRLPYDYNFINRQKMIIWCQARLWNIKATISVTSLQQTNKQNHRKQKKHPSLSVGKKRCNKKNEKRAVLDF